jgi:hypothetical protein
LRGFMDLPGCPINSKQIRMPNDQNSNPVLNI